MYAAYCLIRFKDGGEKAEVMGKDEIDAIRNRSPGKNAAPWNDHYSEMSKKTAAKRAFKWVPLSPEIRDAVDNDSDNAPPMVNVTPITGAAAGMSMAGVLGDEPKTAIEETSSQQPEAEPGPTYTEDELKKLVAEVENLALNTGQTEAKLIKLATDKGWSVPAKAAKLSGLPFATLTNLKGHCQAVARGDS
jgi:recombinational DNA repair protein RecT